MNSTQGITEEQVAEYFREGYIVIRGLVPESAIDAALAAAPAEAQGSGWQARVFDHNEPTKDAGVHRLLVQPEIVDAVEAIFEAPARVYYGMLATVPAHGGNGLPWHQDNQYTRLLGNALNTFVALCDITPDKAILWVAPRSHLSGTAASKDSELYGAGHREAAVEPENGMPLPGLKKGDVCIFDRNTFHRSLQNTTDEPRHAYAAQYMADYSREATTGRKDPLRMPARELMAMLRQ